MSALNKQIAGEHYLRMKIQPVEFIAANNLGFLEGCVIKRMCRWRAKDGLQDLEKARHELDLLIEQENARLSEADAKAAQSSEFSARLNAVQAYASTRAATFGWEEACK